MTHIPVLLNEVIGFLNLKDNGIYVDATLGEGGHSLNILENSGKEIKIIGIDKDLEVLNIAKERLKKFKDRVFIVKDNFKNIDKILKEMKVEKIDGILFDLGVSSFQLESKDRGFSFKYNSSLDMRMDKSQDLVAKDLVNKLPEKDIEEIIKVFGEERFSRRIAENICKERKKKEIETTFELVEVIHSSLPKKFWYKRIHPATKTFQSLRIVVNDELGNLQEALKKALNFMNESSRICIISFHSLEDRIVKRFFNEYSKTENQILKIITKKPVVPSYEEVFSNPRCRSSKLRVAERV
ncbi:MAG: 16S rRNA (cytosine(1402)-N(4))-methyltransferase RsmH [Candidatus Firestonebacteria bacterium]